MVDYSYRDSPYDTFKGSSMDSGFIDFTEEDYERFEKLGLNVQNALAKGATAEEVSQAAKNIEQKQIQTSEREVIREESGLAPPPIQSRPVNVPYQDVPPQPVDDSFWQTDTGPLDMGKAAGASFSNLAGTVVGHGVEWLGEQLQSPTMSQAGQMIKDSSRMASEKMMESMSEGAKAEAYGPRSIFKYEQEGDVIPSGIGNMTLGTIQQLIASGAASSLGILGPAKYIASKLQKIPKVTPGQAGAVGMGTSAGVIEGTATASDVYESTKNTPPEVIVQSPLYQETREHIKSAYPEATEDQLMEFITEQIAKQASWESGWRAGAGIGVTSMPVGSFLGKMGLFGKKAGGTAELRKGLLPTAWTGTTKEARQEFYQEAGQQVSQNFGDYLVGKSPNAINLSGVAEAGAAGALGGGPVGGALATYGNLRLPTKEKYEAVRKNLLHNAAFGELKDNQELREKSYENAGLVFNKGDTIEDVLKKNNYTMEDITAPVDTAEVIPVDLDDAKLSILHELRFPKRYKKRKASEYKEEFDKAGLQYKRGDTFEDLLRNNTITIEDIEMYHADLKEAGRLPDEIVEEKKEQKVEEEKVTTEEEVKETTTEAQQDAAIEDLPELDLAELRTQAKEAGVDAELLSVIDQWHDPEAKNPSAEVLAKVAKKFGMKRIDLYDALRDDATISKILTEQIEVVTGKKPTAGKPTAGKPTTEKATTDKPVVETKEKPSTEKPPAVKDQTAHDLAMYLYNNFEGTKTKSAADVIRDDRSKGKDGKNRWTRGTLGDIAKRIGVEYQNDKGELLTKHKLAENILAYGKKATSKPSKKSEETKGEEQEGTTTGVDVVSAKGERKILEAKAGGVQKGIRQFDYAEDEYFKALQEDAGYDSEKMRKIFNDASKTIAQLEDKGTKRISIEEANKLKEGDVLTKEEVEQIRLAVAHETRDELELRMIKFSPAERKRISREGTKQARKRLTRLITKFLMGVKPESLNTSMSIQLQLLSDPLLRKQFIEYLETERVNAKTLKLQPDDDLNIYGEDEYGNPITAPITRPPDFVSQDEVDMQYTKIVNAINSIKSELSSPSRLLEKDVADKGGRLGAMMVDPETGKMTRGQFVPTTTAKEALKVVKADSQRKKYLESLLERYESDKYTMESEAKGWGRPMPKIVKYTNLNEDTVILKELEDALTERDENIKNINNARNNKARRINKKLNKEISIIKFKVATGEITQEEGQEQWTALENDAVIDMQEGVDRWVAKASKAEAKFAEMAEKHGFQQVDFKPRIYEGDDEVDIEGENARVKEEKRLFTERMNAMYSSNIYVGPAGGYAQRGGRPVISEDENTNIYEHAYHQLGMTGDEHTTQELQELNEFVKADIHARESGTDAAWFKRQESGADSPHWRFNPDNGYSFVGYRLVRTAKGVETEMVYGIDSPYATQLQQDKERLMEAKEARLNARDKLKEKRKGTKDKGKESIDLEIKRISELIDTDNEKLLQIERRLSRPLRKTHLTNNLYDNHSKYKNWKFGDTGRSPTSGELYGKAVEKAQTINPTKPVKSKKFRVKAKSLFSLMPWLQGGEGGRGIISHIDENGYHYLKLVIDDQGKVEKLREKKRHEKLRKAIKEDVTTEGTYSPSMLKTQTQLALRIQKEGGLVSIRIYAVDDTMENEFIGFIEIEDGKVINSMFNSTGIDEHAIHMESINELVGSAVGVYALQHNQTGVSLHPEFYNFKGTMSRIMKRVPTVRESLSPEQQVHYDNQMDILDIEYQVVSTDNYEGHETEAEALRSIPHSKPEGDKGSIRSDYFVHQAEDGLFYALPRKDEASIKKHGVKTKSEMIQKIAEKESDIELKQSGVEEVQEEMVGEETKKEEPVVDEKTEDVPWEESEEYLDNYEFQLSDMKVISTLRKQGTPDAEILPEITWFEEVPSPKEVDAFYARYAKAKTEHESKGKLTEEQKEQAKYEQILESEGLGTTSSPKEAVRGWADAYDKFNKDNEESIGQYDSPSTTQNQVNDNEEDFTEDNLNCRIKY